MANGKQLTKIMVVDDQEDITWSLSQALSDREVRMAGALIMELKKKYPNIINSNAYLKNVGIRTCCYDWWTFMVFNDGSAVHGCTVNSTETPDCSSCYMSCNSEPYHALKLKPDSIRCVRELSGLRSVFGQMRT